jgi:biotin operon repressor
VNVETAIRHYEQSLRLSREAKRRVRGTCVDCGAETKYDGHGRRAALRCSVCAHRKSGETQRGTGRTQARILALLANGPMRFGEIQEALGTYSGFVANHVHRLRKYGLIVRLERGLYALPTQPSAEDGGKPPRSAEESG